MKYAPMIGLPIAGAAITIRPRLVTTATQSGIKYPGSSATIGASTSSMYRVDRAAVRAPDSDCDSFITGRCAGGRWAGKPGGRFAQRGSSRRLNHCTIPSIALLARIRGGRRNAEINRIPISEIGGSSILQFYAGGQREGNRVRARTMTVGYSWM